MTEPLPRGRRLDVLLCLALALVVVAAGWGRALWPACGYRHDDAIYVSTARALYEGRGYRLVVLPGAPRQTKYPPLYPALLAALWAVWPSFPDNIVLLKSFSLACAAAFVAASYLYLTRFGYLTRAVALAACLLAATAHYFADYSTALMAEMLFGLLCVALLWRLDALRLSPREGVGADLLTGLLLALPFLCRSIGIVFIPLGLLLLRGWGRPYRRVGLITGLLILPWIGWTLGSAMAWRGDPVEGYYTDYLGWWMSFGPPVLGRVVGFNALNIFVYTAALPAEGASTILTEAHPLAMVLPMLCVGLVGLAAMARRLARGEALPWLLFGYLLVVLVWPWQPVRFLLPILPALAGFVLVGLGDLARPRLGDNATRNLGILLVLVCLAANVWDLANRSILSHRHGAHGVDAGVVSAPWAEFERTFAWVRANTDEGDILASGSDAMLGIYTRRKAFFPIVCSPLSYIYGMTADADLDKSLSALRLHRPRYLVVTADFHGEDDFRAWVDRLVAAYPEQVRRIYTGDDPRFVIYELSYPLGARGTP